MYAISKKILPVFPVICAAFFFGGALQASAAFGISPPFMNADNLVKGSRYSQTITLVQDQPNQDLRIKATLKISDSVRSWISIDKGFDFVIPKGMQKFPVEITVQVPQDAGLGDYSGNISFVSSPSSAGQVTIALGAQVAINLRVGTGIHHDFMIPLIRFSDIEEGWSPRVQVRLVNGGNVAESLDGATLEVFDKFNAVRLAHVQINKFPEIPPFTTKELTVEFPLDFYLGVGDYWGTVSFYKGDQLLASEHTVFRALETGTLSGIWGKLKKSFREHWVYYLIGLVIAAGVGLWFRRKSRGKIK